MRFITMQHADGTESVWYEVNNAHPCPICGSQHKNQGWCLVKDDESMACCQREDRGSVRAMGGYGDLHILRDLPGPRQYPMRVAVPRQRYEDAKMTPEQVLEIHEQSWAQCNDVHLQCLSSSLGLHGVEYLNLIQTGFRGDGWYSWPMYVGGQMVGIRLRHLDGRKLSVTGSRAGMFIPTNLRQHETMFVAEGATDTAAALAIGLNVIGRPQCMGSEREVERIACDLRPNLVVVVRDLGRADSMMSKDNSYKGAHALVRYLARVRAVKMYTPPVPARDFREAVCAGLTATQVFKTLESDVRLEARR